MPDTTSVLPGKPFVSIAEMSSDVPELDASGVATKLLELGKLEHTDQTYTLDDVLESPEWQTGGRILAACTKGEATRAVSLSEFGRNLFGEECDDETLRAATRGLLIARSLCESSEHLPSFRLHWFFRNIRRSLGMYQPGLWMRII